MVAIFDNKDSPRAENLKSYLRLAGIPCTVSVSDGSVKPYVNVFFEDTAHDFTRYFEAPDRESIVISSITEGGGAAGFTDTYNSVRDVLDVKYGINPDSVCKGKYSCIDGKVVLYGRIITMTDTEKLIVKFLALNMNCYCRTKDILSFCMDGSTNHCLSVHINNINKRVLSLVGKKLISVMRKHGYGIFM